MQLSIQDSIYKDHVEREDYLRRWYIPQPDNAININISAYISQMTVKLMNKLCIEIIKNVKWSGCFMAYSGMEQCLKKTIPRSNGNEQRWAAGKFRLDKIGNERIRQILGVNPKITEDNRINQLRWYGRKMEEKRLPRQLLKWTAQGRRKRGRPRRCWRKGISKTIRKRLWEEPPVLFILHSHFI